MKWCHESKDFGRGTISSGVPLSRVSFAFYGGFCAVVLFIGTASQSTKLRLNTAAKEVQTW